jgi:hypothetical protein
MTAICELLHLEARFADAACCTEPLGGIPDIACLDTAGIPLIVGEVKTWWVHDLKEVWRNGMELRHTPGK